MSKETYILIASNSFDRATTQPIADKLIGANAHPVMYEADKVFSGENSLSMSVEPQLLRVLYDDFDISRYAIQAAWYRRPSMIMPETQDKAKQLRLESEVRELQNSIWNTYDDHTWLNSPSGIQRAEDKMAQLLLAQTVGLHVPETIISNHWQEIDEYLSRHSQVVMKMPYGLLYESGKTKALYTTILNAEIRARLADTTPFPGIYQAFVEKAREWRVTAVDNEVFEAAIYTAPAAKDDWRKHQLDNKLVTFKRETLPDAIKERCLRFLGELGLKFGAFDFVEDNDGKITFLEMNPNGQFMWIEQILDLPISDAIVSSLLHIARTNPST